MTSTRNIALCAAIGDVLTPDLLRGQWKTAFAETGNRFAGHCYAAAEALYHMVGGAKKGWVPQLMTHALWPEGLDPGETHWFIRNKKTGAILDPTERQFGLPVDYAKSMGCGFLTAKPSKRAAVIIDRVKERAVA